MVPIPSVISNHGQRLARADCGLEALSTPVLPLLAEATFAPAIFFAVAAFGLVVETFLTAAFFVEAVDVPAALATLMTYTAELVVFGVGATVQFQVSSTSAQLNPSIDSP